MRVRFCAQATGDRGVLKINKSFFKFHFYLTFFYFYTFLIFLITFIPVTRNVNIPCNRNQCDRSSLWRGVGSIRPPISLLQAYKHEIGEKNEITDHMPTAVIAALFPSGYQV